MFLHVTHDHAFNWVNINISKWSILTFLKITFFLYFYVSPIIAIHIHPRLYFHIVIINLDNLNYIKCDLG